MDRELRSMNQAVVDGYVTKVYDGGAFSLLYDVNPFQHIVCYPEERIKEDLLRWNKRKIPVRVVGKLNSAGSISDEEAGQFQLSVDCVEPLLNFDLTDKGHRSKGKIIIQSFEDGYYPSADHPCASGYFDYTSCGRTELALEELKKKIPFENWLKSSDLDISAFPVGKADENHLKRRWENELAASIGTFSLIDLMEMDDPYGFGVKFGYLKKIEHRSLNARSAVISGTVKNFQDGDSKVFCLSGRGEYPFTVRCSVGLDVDPDCLCQDGKGVRVVGEIHRCTFTDSRGTHSGVEVLAESVQREPSFDVVKKPARQQESGGMEW